MGLTNVKEEQLRKMPIVEARVFKSKSGKFMVHKTVITDIKPLEYYNDVLEGPVAQTEEAQELQV